MRERVRPTPTWPGWLPRLPYPHFMAFAPLDCWSRLLLRRGVIGRIAPVYWLRLGGALCTSALGTALTLPERLVLAPVLRRAYARLRESSAGQRRRGGFDVLVILGYYRSGTTHLHYLLSCDPGMVTPRWYQALAPQGFALSWTLLRYFLVPFLSSRRPQDDVAYGPEYPAEDDFAVCNWSGMCAMPGRMVLPGEWPHYARLHGFENAQPEELDRFRRVQHAFTWKIARLNPGRRVLLKTPSHTARVGELLRLYPGRVKFVHIARDPGAVLASNIALHQRFEPFLLQDHPGDQEIRRRVLAEYDASERRFLESMALVPPGDLARVRYQDLIADPMGQLQRVYAELGIPFTDAARSRMQAYLESVRTYRTAAQRSAAPQRKDQPPASTSALPEELAWMIEAFEHDRPCPPPGSSAPAPSAPAASAPTSEPESAPVRAERAGAYLTALIAALWCAAGWLSLAYVLRDRSDWIIWPVGIIIGLCALRDAGRGTVRLGAWCAMLTVLVLLAVCFPATWITDYRERTPVPWDHVWISTRRGVLALNNWIWIILGVMTAYRFGSREHLRPPGL